MIRGHLIIDLAVSGDKPGLNQKQYAVHFFYFYIWRHIMFNKTSSIKRITLLGLLVAVLVVMGLSDLADARSSSGGRSFGGSSGSSGGFGGSSGGFGGSPSRSFGSPSSPSGGGSFGGEATVFCAGSAAVLWAA